MQYDDVDLAEEEESLPLLGNPSVQSGNSEGYGGGGDDVGSQDGGRSGGVDDNNEGWKRVATVLMSR